MVRLINRNVPLAVSWRPSEDRNRAELRAAVRQLKSYFSDIVSLTLSWSLVSDNGCTQLSEALLENRSLQILDLYYNDITSLGATALSRMLCSNTTLNSLDLSYNTVGNSGALALAGAQNTTLTNLNVQMNHISSEVKSILQAKIGLNVSKFPSSRDKEEKFDPTAEMNMSTKLPQIAGCSVTPSRPFPDPVQTGVFGNDGNSRFQQAVLDRCDVRLNRRRLPVKANKYSLDLV